MAARKFDELRTQLLQHPGTAERIAALRQEILAEIGLYDLRTALEVSQSDLAAHLDVTQSAVSRFEHGGDPRISTLRNYVAALGGRLELRARFDDQEVLLAVGEEPGVYDASVSGDAVEDDETPETT
jgi:transcriptional regulator with XRE-family HTH domain